MEVVAGCPPGFSHLGDRLSPPDPGSLFHQVRTVVAVPGDEPVAVVYGDCVSETADDTGKNDPSRPDCQDGSSCPCGYVDAVMESSSSWSEGGGNPPLEGPDKGFDSVCKDRFRFFGRRRRGKGFLDADQRNKGFTPLPGPVLRQGGQEVRILPRNEKLLAGEDAVLTDCQFVGPFDGPGGYAISPRDKCHGFTAANGMFHPRKRIGRSGRRKEKNCKNGKKA